MPRSLATALLAFLFVLFVGFALTPKRYTYAAIQPPSCLTSTLFLPLTLHQPGNSPLAPVLPAGDQPPQDDPEAGSAGNLIASGIDPNRFNPLTQTLTIDVVCAAFSEDTNAVTVILNNTILAPTDFTLTSQRLLIQPESWHEGLNDVQILASDTKGKTLGMTLTFWAGAEEMEVRVYNETGDFIEGVQVRAALGDDQSIYATAITASGGRVIFQNLPDRTIIFEAHTADNQYGSAAKRGGAGFMTFLKLLDINPPSPIDNNDFSLGTEGWEIGDAPVTIVPHQEDPREAISNSEDMDLVLMTDGEGEQRISRTFETSPGVRNVVVRYIFNTSEIPGGFFGTEFNDYYDISVRSLVDGGVVNDGNSMNGLGRGAFDANGSTMWFETTLPVDMEGDIVQADIGVANVLDDLYNSFVIIDLIEENPISITVLSLNDIDNAPLAYLSADDHPYLGGNTQLHGTITIEGPEDLTIASVQLEVVQGGAVVARGNLASSVQGTLLTTLGSDEKVEVTSVQHLFDLPAAQAALIDSSVDGTVTLQVTVKSTEGASATQDWGAAEILAHYDGANRYGGRDNGVGGDSWIKPSAKELLEHYTDITVGDMSNMNGGVFSPHATHRNGVDVDAWFPGYNEIDANTAATIIGHLNDPEYGARITTVFVTYTAQDGNPFWDAIKNVTLADGRAASAVIRPLKKHDTHFHWVIAP